MSPRCWSARSGSSDFSRSPPFELRSNPAFLPTPCGFGKRALGERSREEDGKEDSMGSILIVAEIQKGKIRDASYELVSMAHKIAGGREIKSLVLGSGVAGEAEVLAKRGGGEVLVADSEALANYNVDGYAKAILAAVEAT